jgi:hypothetical protein
MKQEVSNPTLSAISHTELDRVVGGKGNSTSSGDPLDYVMDKIGKAEMDGIKGIANLLNNNKNGKADQVNNVTSSSGDMKLKRDNKKKFTTPKA